MIPSKGNRARQTIANERRARERYEEMRTQASSTHARRRKSPEPPAPPTPGGGGPIQASKPARAGKRGQGEELELEKTARLNWIGQIKHRTNPSPSCSPSYSTRGAGRVRLSGAKSGYIREPHEICERWGMGQAAGRGEMTTTSPRRRQATRPSPAVFPSSRPRQAIRHWTRTIGR